MNRLLYEEHLRGEIVRFVDALHPPFLAGEDDLLYHDDDSVTEGCAEFLIGIQQRFLYRLDAVGTHRRFTGLMRAYATGQLSRFHLHARVCVLFLGHPEVFHGFERLNNGDEANRNQITEWRDDVRGELLDRIDAVIGECQAALSRVIQIPALRVLVLPGVGETIVRFWQMRRFVVQYFERLDQMPVN